MSHKHHRKRHHKFYYHNNRNNRHNNRENQEYRNQNNGHNNHNNHNSENETKFLKPFNSNGHNGFDKLKHLFTNSIFAGVPRKEVVDQLTLTFLGAAGTVTGSKYLVEFGKTKILVDCGLFQGLKELRLRNWNTLPFNPKNLDAVVLTHAHLDHSGYVPLLVKYGFRGKIYCTRATYDLCAILLPDSGYLQEEGAKFAKKYGFSKHKHPKPLYNQKEAIKSLEYFSPVDFKTETKISDDISFIITGIGHILGAGSVKIKAEGKSIVFSGDVGRPNSPIMKDPEIIEEADYVLVESTYGNRRHEKTDPEVMLENIITSTVNRGGSIVIPAFAVGRSQKVLYYIYKLRQQGKIPNVPVFLDSPMSIKVTNLLDDYADEHKLNREECFAIYDSVKFTVTANQSKEIDKINYPAIIISASGMATGGRVLHHIKRFAPDSKNTLLFTGYQAMGTRGRTIVDGHNEVKMHGQLVPIRSDVKILHNMSAHGDYKEILDWLKGFKKPPKKVFIIHGEPEASLAFEKRIRQELNWETNIPKYLQMEKL